MDKLKEYETLIDQALDTLTKAKDYPNKTKFYLRAMIHLAIRQLVSECKIDAKENK
jgi:hypothetical protein